MLTYCVCLLLSIKIKFFIGDNMMSVTSFFYGFQNVNISDIQSKGIESLKKIFIRSKKKLELAFSDNSEKEWNKWSISLMSIGAVFGIGTGVASVFLSSALLTALSVAILVSTIFFGLWRVYDLETETTLGEKVDSLGRENDRLEKSVRSLSRVRDDLRGTLTEAKEETAQLSLSFKETNDSLISTTSKLEKTMERLQIQGSVLEKMQGILVKFTKGITEVSESTKIFGSLSGDIVGNIGGLHEVSTSLALSINDFQNANEYFQFQNKRLGILEKNMSSHLFSFKEFLLLTDQKLRRLNSHSSVLSESSKRFSEGSKSILDSVEKFGGITSKMDNLLSMANEEILNLEYSSDEEISLELLITNQ